MNNQYLIMKQRHQKEWNYFPMAYAFSNKQFEEAMVKLGLTVNDIDKIYKFGNTGGFYRKTDSGKLKELINRHDEEMKNAMESDLTGDGFLFDMFSYELSNHEYCITYDITDTLDCLGLTEDEVMNNPLMAKALKKAKNNQFDEELIK